MIQLLHPRSSPELEVWSIPISQMGKLQPEWAGTPGMCGSLRLTPGPAASRGCYSAGEADVATTHRRQGPWGAPSICPLLLPHLTCLPDPLASSWRPSRSLHHAFLVFLAGCVLQTPPQCPLKPAAYGPLAPQLVSGAVPCLHSLQSFLPLLGNFGGTC